MVQVFLLMLGGAIGSGLRFGVSSWVSAFGASLLPSWYFIGQCDWFISHRLLLEYGGGLSFFGSYEGLPFHRTIRRFHHLLLLRLGHQRSLSERRAEVGPAQHRGQQCIGIDRRLRGIVCRQAMRRPAEIGHHPLFWGMKKPNTCIFAQKKLSFAR